MVLPAPVQIVRPYLLNIDSLALPRNRPSSMSFVVRCAKYALIIPLSDPQTIIMTSLIMYCIPIIQLPPQP